MQSRSCKRIVVSAAASVLCLAAGACTHGRDEAGASLEQTVGVPREASSAMALAPGQVSPKAPFVHLPSEAGRVTATRARTYVDGFRQDIYLDRGAVTRVRNSITVLARTSRQPTLDEATPLAKPTEAAIRSEIGGAFPNVSMQVVERDSHNAYGPYGLALGRVGTSVRCLYMWQWIDENRLALDAGVSGPVSVRVRLCQAGTTFDAMAALADHLSIGGVPVVADGDIQVISAPPEVDAARRMHKPARRTAHRLRSAAPHVAAREMQAPESGRMHYVALPSPGLTASGAVPSKALATDLPPQAYLGPKAKAF